MLAQLFPAASKSTSGVFQKMHSIVSHSILTSPVAGRSKEVAQKEVLLLKDQVLNSVAIVVLLEHPFPLFEVSIHPREIF